MKWPSHGANPHYLTEKMDLPPVTYDLSVNVNPLGPPKWLKEEWDELYATALDYPDPGCGQLIRVLAEEEGVPGRHLLAGNGASELLMLIGQLFAGKRVLIVEPTFSEYRTIAGTYGCQVKSVFLTEAEAWRLPVERVVEKATNADLVVICNPNNPTGVHYELDELLFLLEHMKAHLLVDEAFYDFVEKEPTLLPYVKEFPRLLVLRSLTKMYAVAGLRIGYLAGDPRLIKKIAAFQPAWSVNGLAQTVGAQSAQDHEFRRQTREFVKLEKERMFPEIHRLGFTISNTSVNFYLLGGWPNLGETLLPYLLEKGIAARHTYNFPGMDGEYLRFSISYREANDALFETLAGWSV
ncbi:histidinol-phosphate transaminase [Halobacillus sp. A5]|uniref:pyridoxal phosphate-dependent aminotransferase n=1 Tax=Halobacillus sp. A5 TaxID=2880263 RepID=UPI0020A6BAB6|nr:aminotransferase class I/II-fold pyridoxal phosphate-dependent enzyme [Halobacillus sp. A5]MCP3027865.1 aminotransferase class I/II-fold pyridoxal phosphate-dependent enzyme [Halobacillus sp. A5]